MRFEFTSITVILVLILLCAFLFVGQFNFNIEFIKELNFAKSISDWGATGDFFGGILNPIIAFCSLLFLIRTLRQNNIALKQSEHSLEQGKKAIEQNVLALEISNNELKLTREESAKSASSLKEQERILKIQRFENTFFNLVSLHNEIIDNLDFKINEADDHWYEHFQLKENTPFFIKRNSFRNLFSLIINTSNSIYMTPEDIYNYFNKKENHNFGHYSRNLFQIIKYIDNSEIKIDEKKQYSNFIRAQFSSVELDFLFLNCIDKDIDNGEFRDYMIKYQMLEHIGIEYGENECLLTTSGIYVSTESVQKYCKVENGGIVNTAFGNNPVISTHLGEYEFQ
ncbi:putative phage abortive infection protein [Pseudoalteromonas luteoviolacea]|uniref:Phage abortive infection protein n=1 Tax=Pseudoalteromonas luteoviolacea S4060-1 TaxID=1365257 RepID=A0A162BG39_9GAMM|nr:putative phage abortive infection protein [Pseudoalteromonas luteoviolacea]KZN61537.1 hypothetical protein N478_05540 [Pseudoalteromonas luteoviolacea S4060-1]